MDKKQAQKKLEKKKVVWKVWRIDVVAKGKSPKKKGVVMAKIEKPKRKDSRQVKIERLEAEVNLLCWENAKLKAENADLKENISKEIDTLGKRVIDTMMNGCKHKAEVIRLRRWVWILAGALFAYSVLNIILGFYGI